MSAKKTRHLKQTIDSNGTRTITNSEAGVFHCRFASAQCDWRRLCDNVAQGIGADFCPTELNILHHNAQVTVIMG